MDRGSNKTTKELLPGPMVWVMAAALGYVAMAVYLFKPHWGQWGRWQVLWPINMVLQLKLRVPGLRQVAVFGAAGLDIVLSARLVADAVL